jgi:23S rRNA pseudouridine955/2504/2580 synthase
MTPHHPIAEADDGIRLDRWFKRHHPAYPHAMLEKNLRKGLIRLDGKKARSSDRITAGQVIEIRVQDDSFSIQPKKPKPKTFGIKPEEAEAIRSWVLYEDAHLVVLNKPFGLPVQGGSKVGRSVDSISAALVAPDAPRPKLVHRLDRDTSGVLVLAKTAKAAATLSRAFAGREAEKTYWALTAGVPEQFRGMVDYKLLKAQAGDEFFERVAVDDEDGKYARTEYKVLDALARKFAFMELNPLTGRTHQLRVHMQAIGCPIVGDHKYGGSMDDAKALGVANQLHLHARRLRIPAAGGLKALDVKAPLPEHMRQSFEALGIDIPK